MTSAALMRQESRGSHFREEYPEQDNKTWSTKICFYMVDSTLKQETGKLSKQ